MKFKTLLIAPTLLAGIAATGVNAAAADAAKKDDKVVVENTKEEKAPAKEEKPAVKEEKTEKKAPKAEEKVETKKADAKDEKTEKVEPKAEAKKESKAKSDAKAEKSETKKADKAKAKEAKEAKVSTFSETEEKTTEKKSIDKKVSNGNPAEEKGTFVEEEMSLEYDEENSHVYVINRKAELEGYINAYTVVFYSTKEFNKTPSADDYKLVDYYFDPALDGKTKPDDVAWGYVGELILADTKVLWYHGDNDATAEMWRNSDYGLLDLVLPEEDEPVVEEMGNDIKDSEPEVETPAVEDDVTGSDLTPDAEPYAPSNQPELPATGEADQTGLALLGMSTTVATYYFARRKN